MRGSPFETGSGSEVILSAFTWTCAERVTTSSGQTNTGNVSEKDSVIGLKAFVK